MSCVCAFIPFFAETRFSITRTVCFVDNAILILSAFNVLQTGLSECKLKLVWGNNCYDCLLHESCAII